MTQKTALTRRTFAVSAIMLAAAFASPSLARNATAPNIIFIMADDMGYSDLSRDGAQGYRTPVLDRLAADGMRFSQAYANSAVCSPTRTALITGRYQYRFAAGLAEPNIRFNPGEELPAGTPTLASLLKDQGYRTALIGKWHVTKVPNFGPQQYGYDRFFGFPSGAADYFRHGYISEQGGKSELHEGSELAPRTGYLTDILADEAIREISSKDSRPLFLSLHFNAPHWPWEGPEDEAHAANLKQMSDLSGGSLETYAAMMRSMDGNIGRVLQALKKAGKDKNTIVIFTSDNGGERYSNNWPFSGYKTELLEGGIRVPMIVRWPGHIPAGKSSTQVTISMDFLPTLLAAAGQETTTPTDGLNILPQLLGRTGDVPRTLYWRYNAASQRALRDGDWKYLRIGSKEALFNVARDPRERADLKAEHPERFARLKAQWEAWNETMLPYPASSASEGTMRTYIDRYAPRWEPKDK